MISVSGRFHLDTVDWLQSAGRTEHLGAVADAVWRARRIAVRDESWKGLRDRELEPLGLVLKAGIWYVAARTGKGAAPRTYRLSSIRALTVSHEAFSPPPQFDLADYWQESTGRFETDLYRDKAELRLSTRGVRRMKEFSTAVAQAIEATATTDRGGWSRVVVPIESIEHAADQLIGLGAEAEVLAPEAPRDRMRSVAQRLARLYADP